MVKPSQLFHIEKKNGLIILLKTFRLQYMYWHNNNKIIF